MDDTLYIQDLRIENERLERELQDLKDACLAAGCTILKGDFVLRSGKSRMYRVDTPGQVGE